VRNPQLYVDFLTALKGDPARIITAAIAGNPTPFTIATSSGVPALQPSCTSGSGSAVPGVRFDWFLDQFPGRSAFTSICSGSLSSALGIIGTTIATAMNSVCLAQRPLDSDPTTAALDAACTVQDVEAYGTTAERVVATLPTCASTTTGACYTIVEASTSCPTAPNLELQVHRRGVPAPSGTRPVIRCTWPR
jgi:hypothetical protein